MITTGTTTTRPSSFIALLTCAALAACGGDVTGPMEALPRELTAAEQKIIHSSNRFGVELLKEVYAREVGPNVVISPLSASMALGMTLNGAAGET